MAIKVISDFNGIVLTLIGMSYESKKMLIFSAT